MRRRKLTLAAWILLSLAVLPCTSGVADDWPHWRGPNRDGTTGEPSGWTGGTWPPSDAAWSTQVGAGGSSVLAVKDQVYAVGWHGEQDHVSCLNAATGETLWTVSYGCPERGRFAMGDEGLYSGPNASPEYDARTGLLYTLSIDGHLNCWDTKHEGRKVWGLNLYDSFNVSQRPHVGSQGHRDYGYSTAPLVQGDAVIVEVGSSVGNLAAFSKRTGKRLWTSKNTDPAGHAGGFAPIEVESVPCVAVLTLQNLVVVRLDGKRAGDTVAQYEWITDFGNSIASPAVYENHVLITSGYNHESICKLTIDLNGAKKAWEQPFHSKICTPVIHNGFVYWSWMEARCLDWNTGESKWAGGDFGDAGSCIVTSDARLIVWGRQGRLALVETADRSPDGYRELAVLNGLSTTDVWPHAVLAGGRLLLKDRLGNLQCFKVR